MKKRGARRTRREWESIPSSEAPPIEFWRWVDPDDLTALLPLLPSPFAEVVRLALRPPPGASSALEAAPDVRQISPPEAHAMSHNIDRCDFIDMLEESAKTHRTLVVTLRGAARFTDHVRDVVTEQGEDFALFREHGRVPVSDILDCVWSAPRESTYDGKL